MKFAKIATVVLLAAVIFAGLSAMMTDRTMAQDQNPGQGDISAKLDQVISGQNEIMAAITSLKEELNIVKIRVTQRQ